MAETRKEDDRLFKAVVNKMLRTPPKPHEDMKVRKSKTKSLKPWAKDDASLLRDVDDVAHWVLIPINHERTYA